MGKQSANKKTKVKLAHPPGHIFWKKDAPVDRLSIFIERVVKEFDGKDIVFEDIEREEQLHESYPNKEEEIPASQLGN